MANGEEEYAGNMDQELKTLKILISVYGLSFTLHSILDMVTGLKLYTLIIFESDYPGMAQLAYFLWYFFTEALPIGRVFHIHYSNFTQNQNLILEQQREGLA